MCIIDIYVFKAHNQNMNRPNKLDDVISLVRSCVAAGNFTDTRHAEQRQGQRKITRFEIVSVLETGYHEKKKDEFKPEYQSWNYAIRGKTLDKRELRIAVAFDEATQMLIITAIDLT